MKIENKQIKGKEKALKKKYHFVEGDKKIIIKATSIEEAERIYKEK